MTDTLISLISIYIGILGANLTGFVFKKQSFGVVGNTILGVFGSVFFIKSFGRLGFDPVSIMQSEEGAVYLFCVNAFISFIGGALAVLLLKKITTKRNNN